MKLHLPKLLCVAVLSTLTVNAVDLTYSADKTTYDIGIGSGSSVLVNKTIGEDGVVIGEDVTVGCYDETAGNFIADFDSVNAGRSNSLEIKKTVKEKNWLGKETIKEKTGDLTITDNGQVVVAGRVSGASEFATLTADNVNVKGDGSVVNLNASVLKANTLTITSGKVMLHGATTSNSDFTQGNAYLGGTLCGVTPKQAQINKSITIEDGELIVGVKADPAYVSSKMHYVMGFGKHSESSCTITQKGGTMAVYGDAVAQSGFSINQSGDKNADMIIRDNLAIIAAGKMSVNQSNNNANLIIGRIVDDEYSTEIPLIGQNIPLGTTSNIEVTFNQTASGNIQLASGTDFDSKKGTIKINQSGGGTFTIGGGIAEEYQPENGMHSKRVAFTNTNTTYQITQNGEAGGHLIIKEGEIIASSVNQTVGDISVEGNASLSAGEINAGGAVISGAELTNGTLSTANGTVTNTGVLEASKVTVNSGALKVDGANAALNTASVTAGGAEISGNVVLTDGAISAAEKNVTISGNLNADGIVVNSGMVTNNGVILVDGQIVLNEGSKLVNNGTIASASPYSVPFALMTAEEQGEEANIIVVNSGAVFDNSNGEVDRSILVDGGTVTLGTGTTQDITMNDGIIYVTGKVETGSLTLNGGSLIFEEGATVVLSENCGIELADVEIIINVEDVNDLSETVLFTSASGQLDENLKSWEGTQVSFKDGNNRVVVGTISGDINGGSLNVTVPEPATATLSLLALAGLAVRRRRAA